MDKWCDIIYSYLEKNFSMILNFFSSDVFFCGGALKDLILEEKIKDLDFIVFSESDSEIKDFIKKYNLYFRRNRFNGYKIFYNDLVIDIWNSTSLYECIEYNYDALFYDIGNNQLISFGFFECIETEKIVKLNYWNNLEEADLIRIKKIKIKLEKLIKLQKFKWSSLANLTKKFK